MQKRILTILFLLASFGAWAQVPMRLDTLRDSTTLKTGYQIYGRTAKFGRLIYFYDPSLNKSDLLVTSKYLRQYYLSKADSLIYGINANNGLTKIGGLIKLGGALTANTTINLNGRRLFISDSSDPNYIGSHIFRNFSFSSLIQDNTINKVMSILSANGQVQFFVGNTIRNSGITLRTDSMVVFDDINSHGLFYPSGTVYNSTDPNWIPRRAYVDAAITTAGGNYVPNSRQINTGLGANGGGDLSANRTISVDTTVIKSKASALTDYNNLSSRINGKLNISDTTGLARKNGSADIIENSYTARNVTTPTTPATNYTKLGFDNNGAETIVKSNGQYRKFRFLYNGSVDVFFPLAATVHVADRDSVIALVNAARTQVYYTSPSSGTTVTATALQNVNLVSVTRSGMAFYSTASANPTGNFFYYNPTAGSFQFQDAFISGEQFQVNYTTASVSVSGSSIPIITYANMASIVYPTANTFIVVNANEDRDGLKWLFYAPPGATDKSQLQAIASTQNNFTN